MHQGTREVVTSGSKWRDAVVGAVAYLCGLAMFVGRGALSVMHASELRAKVSEPAEERARVGEQFEAVALAYANDYLDAGTVDILASVNSGAREYLNTMVDLIDPAFVSEQRLGCADEHAREIRVVCEYHIEMLIKRKDESRGKIAYARAFMREDEPRGVSADNVCWPYVECLAKIRVGELIRIPDNGEPRLALSQGLQSSWVTPDLFDPEFAERLREEWRRSVEFHGPAPTFEEPKDELSYEFKRRLVPYLDVHIERLRRASR
jgi:hypothetical protein